MTLRTHCGTKFVIDDEDYERVIGLPKFYLSPYGYVVFRPKGSRQNQSKEMLHRFLLMAPKHLHVDHKNGDKLDNRKCNIRLCLRKENMRNMSPSRRRKHGFPFKGIESRGRTWGAVLRCDGIRFRSPPFSTPEEAARAYDELAQKHHGEFARLNFPV